MGTMDSAKLTSPEVAWPERLRALRVAVETRTHVPVKAVQELLREYDHARREEDARVEMLNSASMRAARLPDVEGERTMSLTEIESICRVMLVEDLAEPKRDGLLTALLRNTVLAVREYRDYRARVPFEGAANEGKSS